MKLISLLPADTYTVINKTILLESDRKNIITLYEPIIGPIAVSLYLTLWRDLDKLEIFSNEFSHHHLMTILKSDLDTIRIAREALEATGLLKTYYEESEVNNYIYELYSPLSAAEFFNHPIFNVVLYNNVGKNEYNQIKSEYEQIKINLEGYTDISKTMNSTFKVSNMVDSFLVKERKSLGVNLVDQIDFDELLSAMPKGIFNEKTLNKKTKELINSLSYIYDLDTLKMIEIIRMSLNSKGYIEKENLRIQARKYYQFNNNGVLPTIIYRSQPDYLKTPAGDLSNRGKIIQVFENTTPYDFLKSKYKGVNPTSRDLKLLEYLLIDLELKPAVVNVLIDYVLRKNNNKLNQAFVETIAGQWKRSGIETAKEAMEIAEKEHKKYNKKIEGTTNKKISSKEPVWFDKVLDSKKVSESDQKELEEMFKEFR